MLWAFDQLPADDRLVDAGLGEVAWRVVLIVVLVAGVEELLFRGVLWESLSRFTDRALWVVLASSALFGLWHFGSAWQAAERSTGSGIDGWVLAANMVAPALAGLVLGWARLRSRSLLGTDHPPRHRQQPPGDSHSHAVVEPVLACRRPRRELPLAYARPEQHRRVDGDSGRTTKRERVSFWEASAARMAADGPDRFSRTFGLFWG